MSELIQNCRQLREEAAFLYREKDSGPEWKRALCIGLWAAIQRRIAGMGMLAR